MNIYTKHISLCIYTATGAAGVVPDRLQLPGEQDRPHTQPDPVR